MRINGDFIGREVAGEIILVPTGSTALNFAGMCIINEVGYEIWKMLKEGKSETEIINSIIDQYEIDLETIKNDYNEFIKYLKEKKLVTDED